MELGLVKSVVVQVMKINTMRLAAARFSLEKKETDENLTMPKVSIKGILRDYNVIHHEI